MQRLLGSTLLIASTITLVASSSSMADDVFRGGSCNHLYAVNDQSFELSCFVNPYGGVAVYDNSNRAISVDANGEAPFCETGAVPLCSLTVWLQDGTKRHFNNTKFDKPDEGKNYGTVDQPIETASFGCGCPEPTWPPHL